MTKPYQGGLFSPPISTAISKPYYEARLNEVHGASKGVKQFGIGKGINSEFKRLFEGEVYMPQSKVLAKQRLLGKTSFQTSAGFKHVYAIKKSTSSGDYYGTISKKPLPHISDGKYGDRTKVAQKFEGSTKKNIYTKPPKKASGLSTTVATTPNVLFTRYEYFPDDYDAFEKDSRARSKESRELRGDRLPFKVGLAHHSSGDFKDEEKELVEIFANSNKTIHTEKADEESNEARRAFRPSSPGKSLSPYYGAFNQYPEHIADPLDEKTIARSKATARLLPLTEHMSGLSDKLKERKNWIPSSPAKTMFVRSPLMMETSHL